MMMLLAKIVLTTIMGFLFFGCCMALSDRFESSEWIFWWCATLAMICGGIGILIGFALCFVGIWTML